MEQTKCLKNTWNNISHDHHHLPIPSTTKTMKRFNQQSSLSCTWDHHHHHHQEEAFSESAIHVGESLIKWPPRSYSCSFCKREFRSAQALGGHMNVHRRDRALLKQQEVIINTNNDDNHVINPSNDQVCSPKTNNNSVATHHSIIISRVSSNNPVINHGINKVISSSNDMGLDSATRECQKQEEEEEDFFKHKRFKKSNNEDDYYNNSNNNVALFQFFDDEEIKCSNNKNVKDNCGLQKQQVLSVRGSKSMEELDLELRLGDPLQNTK